MAKDKFLSFSKGKKRAPNNTEFRKSKKINVKGSNALQKNDVDPDIDELGPSAAYESSSDNQNLESAELDSSNSEFEFETEAEKRLRLAKEYVSKLKADAEEIDGVDAVEIDRDLVASRLQQDVEENSGRIYLRIADKFTKEYTDLPTATFSNGHHLPVTSVAVSPNGKYIFSCSKDGSIVKWDFQTRKKLIQIKGRKKNASSKTPGHSGEVLSLAISSDGKYLASGGSDSCIHIWETNNLNKICTFRQHRNSVTGLAFRKGHNQLYSCSLDRMVKLWDVDQRGFIETLFGHQDAISDICTYQREQAVTVGSRDKTARVWKIINETQLVFRGGIQTNVAKVLNKSKYLQLDHGEILRLPDDDDSDQELSSVKDNENQDLTSVESSPNASVDSALVLYKKDLIEARKNKLDFAEGSIDVVAMIDEETFVTGGDSGAISLWSFSRKKPIYTVHLAHGAEINGSLITPRWITSISSIPLSDIFFSGSYDGLIKIWKIAENKANRFSLINTIPVEGYINRIVLHQEKPRNRNQVIVETNPITTQKYKNNINTINKNSNLAY
ncbi:hypothetical protein BB560_003643 [Smittium megazygosporum]|uniref:Ribosomal RNA-processing protein 9 n=1 Tax=Smittium megazygosporum TaxID=133381 RepID=A0A2T9ZBD1_9FUNG|nr:hypothetical protein BB560_003643 [Smittium megazygosporum]